MNFIVAVDQEYGIGKDNKLLTYLPNDLPRFKKITMGKTIVMGRRTLESLPGGKPLKGRNNIVLSRDKSLSVENATVVHSVEELMCVIGENTADVFVMGGGGIYNLLMPYCQFAYITKIEKVFDADTFINNVDEIPSWKLMEKSDASEHEDFTYYYTKYENCKVQNMS